VSGIARSKTKSLAHKALASPWIAPLLLRKLRRNAAQKTIAGVSSATFDRSETLLSFTIGAFIDRINSQNIAEIYFIRFDWFRFKFI